MTAVDDKRVTREQGPRVEEPTPREVRPTAAPARPPERGWIVPLAVLIVGSFMSVLDSSIVNVAIPDIQVELSGSADAVAWVVTGYSLALGVVVPLSGGPGPGRLPRRVHRLARDLLHQRPDRHLRRRTGAGRVPRVRPTTWPRFDLWGFLTIAYALFALLLAFSEGQSWGWTGYRVIILVASALISLALFVIIELEVDNPIIDLRVFRCYPYTLSLVLISITTTALFTGLYFLPQFLQQVQGMQSLDAGLVLTPAAMVLLVLMPVSGRIYDLIGPRYPVMLGLAVIAAASYELAQLTPDTTRGYIELWLAVRNVGVGLAMMPIMTSGVSALSRQLTTSGSAMNNIMQRVSSSVAVAVFGGLNIAAVAQMTSDRGAMVTGVAPDQLYAAYQQLSSAVTTQAYDNGFSITAWLCAGAALLAVTMRSGRRAAGGGSVVVEV